MEKKRHLPPRDAKWAKVAPPMEHRAPEEVLPVTTAWTTTPLISSLFPFKLIFTIYSTF